MTNGFMSMQIDDLELDTLDNDPEEATQNLDPNNSQTNDANDNTPRQNWKKRYSDQQRYIVELKKRITTLEQEIANLDTKPIEIPTTIAELDLLKKSNPELVNSIISLIRLEIAEKDKEFAKKLKELDEKSSVIDTETKVNEVLKVHPDAKRIKASQEFADWFELQGEATQNLLRSTNPKDWIRGISLYKEDMGIKPTKVKKADAATATNISSGSDTNLGPDKRTWKASEVASMTDAQYEKYSADIIKAHKEGRYINDLPK